MKPGFIYILTNKNNTTLYIGVTADLEQRIKQHKSKINKKSFTARYNLSKLVYYEAFQMIGDAIAREKQLKGGSRAQKIALIESINPEWEELFYAL
tara:strand:- start:254 stop:541 length:288 start_codon:yes stop_codon:yes gene_type:complete